MPQSTIDGFHGLTLVSFESRMADIMVQALSKKGGKVLSAPSLQEIPLEKNSEAFAFGDKLMQGSIDVMIMMTGIGLSMLMDVLATRYPKEQMIQALSRVTTVARGPKPVKVMKDLGIPVTITIPEPNTWMEILETLDLSRKSLGLEGKVVAVQEYGISNEELIRGLKKRGASVLPVPVYRWALPDNTEPLENAIGEMIAGRVDFAFFTNAMQVRHVFKIASARGLEDKLRQAFRRVVTVSIGPTCSEAIHDAGISVDFEPSHPKLGQMIAETAARSAELLREKKAPGVQFFEERKPFCIDAESRRKNSVFLKACRREAVPYTPVWLMRQAGRYMKEYRNIRSKVSFADLCRSPELAAEVTITACERIKADAAIIFSDILLIVEPMGMSLEYSRDDGPVISSPDRWLKNVDQLREIDERELSFVYEAIRMTRRYLSPDIPLLGFSGAPFTLASYMIEGGGSKSFLKTKQFMYSDPSAWTALLEKINRGLVKYLTAQVEAGADALQIFDSWVGCLGPEDYRRYVFPSMRQLFEKLPKQVPLIHFGTGTACFLKEMSQAGGDVIGVDFRVELGQAWRQIGYEKAIQGNLDPAVLCASRDLIRDKTKLILDQAQGKPGHIFNLGHGILPHTPVENVIALIEMVHEISRAR